MKSRSGSHSGIATIFWGEVSNVMPKCCQNLNKIHGNKTYGLISARERIYWYYWKVPCHQPLINRHTLKERVLSKILRLNHNFDRYGHLQQT